MNLETKTSYLAVVYRPKLEDPELSTRFQRLREWFDKNVETYAAIVHDLDMDGDQRMSPHIHFVAKTHECKRLCTWLNDLAETLGVNPLSISIQKASDVRACVRYLVHKDDPQKHQYALSSIVHNWGEKEFLQNFADARKEDINFDFLLDLCRRSNTLSELICVIGIGTYRYWRPVITDIWNDTHKR